MEQMQSNVDILWIIIAAALVMFMQAGFTALESGLTQAKNSINVAMKNITDFILSVLIFFVVGYAVMFGDGNSFMGWSGFALEGLNTPHDYASFVFQATFAGTAATIVSGAIAERMRFTAYAIVCVVVCALIYPISGHWIWNSAGWLAEKQMVDFAGSTVVHSLGGWVGLAGALVLGPRMGRFNNRKPSKIHGHNLVLAVVGVVILWFGWIGFNGGSTLSVTPDIALIVANTMLSAAAGGLGCFITSAVVHQGEIQIEKLLNGVVGGLVAITAGCAVVNPAGAVGLGLLGGIIVFFSEELVANVLKLDDPVNVISAHGIAGAWGTIALAFFAPAANLPLQDSWNQAMVQATGVLAVFVWGFGGGFLMFGLLKIFNFLRVPPEAEREGLNVYEHGATSGLLKTMEAMDSIVKAYNGSGESDLTHRIEVEIGSEAGEVAGTFNQLMDAFHDSIFDIKTCAEQIDDAAGLMLQSSDEMKSESSEHNANLLVISDAIQNLCDSINESRTLAATVARESGQAEELAQAGFEQAESTHQCIAGLEHQISLSRDNINQLVDQTTKVASILENINGISEQTNLLALNAAIEAARAGEAGRGFAVVAGEVRQLSAHTQAATLEIKQVMADLGKLAKSACDNMALCSQQSDMSLQQVHAANQRFHNIVEQVSCILTSANAALVCAQLQDQCVKQASQGVDSMESIRNHTKARAGTVSAASEQLSQLADVLQNKLVGLKVSDQERRNGSRNTGSARAA